MSRYDENVINAYLSLNIINTEIIIINLNFVRQSLSNNPSIAPVIEQIEFEARRCLKFAGKNLFIHISFSHARARRNFGKRSSIYNRKLIMQKHKVIVCSLRCVLNFSFAFLKLPSPFHLCAIISYIFLLYGIHIFCSLKTHHIDICVVLQLFFSR